MEKINILMATYNGEAFLEEQVQSIIAQSFTDWRLLIHDDGSTDNTVNILRRLMQKDNRIQLLEDGISHMGVARNFIHLVTCTSAPYCMFCDQDDVWQPNKVEKMVHAIEQCDPTIPQVLYTNSFLWSPERGIISDKNTLTYPTTLRQTLFLNTGIQGAAAIFNRAMCLEIKPLLPSNKEIVTAVNVINTPIVIAIPIIVIPLLRLILNFDLSIFSPYLLL